MTGRGIVSLPPATSPARLGLIINLNRHFMLYYLLDIIPKIQAYSKKLDEASLLTNQHWVSVSEIENSKIVYIFRPNEELLISDNGKIERGKWEYLGSNSLIIDRLTESFLFKHGFLDESVLALKVDGTDTYALFVNETKYGKEINNKKDVIKFLEAKYLNKKTENLGSEYQNAGNLNDKRVGSVQLEDSGELIFYSTEKNQTCIIEGCFVLLNGTKPKNGLYKSKQSKRFEVDNGILVNEFHIEKHEQQNGDVIEIDVHRMQTTKKGSRVWIHNQPVPDGQYKAGFFSSINVLNGLVK